MKEDRGLYSPVVTGLGSRGLWGPCWRHLKPYELHGSAWEILALDVPKSPIFPPSQEGKNTSLEPEMCCGRIVKENKVSGILTSESLKG